MAIGAPPNEIVAASPFYEVTLRGRPDDKHTARDRIHAKWTAEGGPMDVLAHQPDRHLSKYVAVELIEALTPEGYELAEHANDNAGG